jgi:hypothetical protein
VPAVLDKGHKRQRTPPAIGAASGSGHNLAPAPRQAAAESRQIATALALVIGPAPPPPIPLPRTRSAPACCAAAAAPAAASRGILTHCPLRILGHLPPKIPNSARLRCRSPRGSDLGINSRSYLSLWPLEITGRDLQLEPADRSIVAKIVAWLWRVVACKDDRQRVIVGVERLRIIDSPAEEVRVVPP